MIDKRLPYLLLVLATSECGKLRLTQFSRHQLSAEANRSSV